MNIDRITYKKKFPTGMFLNEDIGFECSIDSNFDEPLSVINLLRELAELSHKKQYPHLYTSNGKPITIEQVPEGVINKEAERIEIKIDNCTTVEELKLLEGDALKYNLVEQYINKKKSLQ